jgi:UDPglucose 6-dehydrogenase
MPEVHLAGTAYAVAEGADALVLVTEWDEFRALDLGRIARSMLGNILMDLRNVYDPKHAEQAGLRYFSIGRGDQCRRTLAVPASADAMQYSPALAVDCRTP